MGKNVLKTIDILEVISNSDRGLNQGQIANRLGGNRTTTFRLLRALEARGYLTREGGEEEYQIGMKLLPMAAKLLNNNRLRIISLPHLQELAKKTGETIHLGILYDGEVLLLGGVDKPSLPMMYSEFGKKVPAHCCSLGKIMLAHLPEGEVDRLLDRKPLIKLTGNTITDRQLFKQNLAEIRSKGYAIDYEEHLPGVYCIGALIKGSEGRQEGAVSISSGDLEKLKGHLSNLLETAEILSHFMGYTLV